ncbi:hypothetical protein [Yoonia sp. R2-816]|uniref:hypothetical protein n=1 Tax=Yoonia sp. R2-816 TaxID=3342638 RepID=UPI003727042A
MKLYAALAFALLVSASAHAEDDPSSEEATRAVNALAIERFGNICRANLSDPDAARAAAEAAGFTFVGTGTGIDERANLTFQINTHPTRAIECIIVRGRVGADYSARDDFFRSLGFTHQRGVAQIAIDGETYVFMHVKMGGQIFTVLME